MTLAEEIKIKVELLEDELDYVQSVKEKALEEVEKLRKENEELRTILTKLETILGTIVGLDFDDGSCCCERGHKRGGRNIKEGIAVVKDGVVS